MQQGSHLSVHMEADTQINAKKFGQKADKYSGWHKNQYLMTLLIQQWPYEI